MEMGNSKEGILMEKIVPDVEINSLGGKDIRVVQTGIVRPNVAREEKRSALSGIIFGYVRQKMMQMIPKHRLCS